MQRGLKLGEKYFEKKKSNISVVIPSLGGVQLVKTIRNLNIGIIKPDKILICVPKSIFPKYIYFKKKSNLELIQCPTKGQVKQKINGFSRVNTKYTFQIDDDIIVNKTCLKFLLHGAMTKTSKNAFGCYLKSKNNLVSENSKPGIFKQFVNLFFYGQRRLQMRSILKTGIPTDLFDQKDLFMCKTDWLNGIIFTNTKNLIKFDYFKFEGKAYNEDIIYSAKLKKNNVNLWMNNKAVCFEQTQNYVINKEKWDFKYWIKIYKTRKIITSLYQGSYLKMIFFIYLQISKIVLLKLLKK